MLFKPQSFLKEFIKFDWTISFERFTLPEDKIKVNGITRSLFERLSQVITNDYVQEVFFREEHTIKTHYTTRYINK